MKAKHKQGTLDGLCGVYAAVIAWRGVVRPALLKDEQALYEACCRSISSWPRTLWEGLDFDELIEMIDGAIRLEPKLFRSVTISYPFRESPPETSEKYWQQFAKLFEAYPNGRALIGMSKPDDHWLVVRMQSDKRLEVIDPSPMRQIKCKNISDIHAGPNKRSAKSWQIQRNELVFFTPKKA